MELTSLTFRSQLRVDSVMLAAVFVAAGLPGLALT